MVEVAKSAKSEEGSDCRCAGAWVRFKASWACPISKQAGKDGRVDKGKGKGDPPAAGQWARRPRCRPGLLVRRGSRTLHAAVSHPASITHQGTCCSLDAPSIYVLLIHNNSSSSSPRSCISVTFAILRWKHQVMAVMASERHVKTSAESGRSRDGHIMEYGPPVRPR